MCTRAKMLSSLAQNPKSEFLHIQPDGNVHARNGPFPFNFLHFTQYVRALGRERYDGGRGEKNFRSFRMQLPLQLVALGV